VRALLISLAALLVWSPAALAQSPVDDAIDALQNDTVYVDPNGPQGFTPQIADAYRDQIDKAGGDIHLALLPAGAADSAEDAIAAIRDGVGKSGTYAVLMDNHFRVAGSSDARDAADQAFAAHKQDGPQIVIQDWLDRMATVGDSGGGGGGGGPDLGALILIGAAAVGGGG